MPRGRLGAWGVLGCALIGVSAACGAGSRATIRVPAPVLAAMEEPALPQAPGSTLTVALEVELERVRAAIEAALPGEHRQDWTLVTREGASPRIELRYFVQRDPVSVEFERGGLRIELPLRYWADVRGAVKSPLPWQRDRWFELDRDQSWGTRARPQRASLVVRSEVQLAAHGELRIDSRVQRLAPGDPPSGSLCVKAGIRLCVAKRSFASDVAKAFEQRIEPAVRDALAELDRDLERRADLRDRLVRAWQTLHCPWSLHGGAGFACQRDPRSDGPWLQLRAQRLAASELGKRGKRLRVLVSVVGQVQVTRGPQPASTAAEPPAIETRKVASGSVLHVPVAVPYDLLSDQLALALPSPEISLGRAGDVRLVAARIVGARASQAGARCVVELRLAGAVDAVLYAHAQPRAAGGAFELAELEYTEDSERAFAAAFPDVDHGRLRIALARALRVELEPAARLAAQALSAAVTQADARLQPAIAISRVALSDFRPGPRSLAALLVVEGRVRVAIDPGRKPAR